MKTKLSGLNLDNLAACEKCGGVFFSFKICLNHERICRKLLQERKSND